MPSLLQGHRGLWCAHQFYQCSHINSSSLQRFSHTFISIYITFQGQLSTCITFSYAFQYVFATSLIAYLALIPWCQYLDYRSVLSTFIASTSKECPPLIINSPDCNQFNICVCKRACTTPCYLNEGCIWCRVWCGTGRSCETIWRA